MRRVRADARAGLPPAAGREGAGPGPPPAAGREGADPGAGPGLGTAAGGEGTETGLPPAAGGERAEAEAGNWPSPAIHSLQPRPQAFGSPVARIKTIGSFLTFASRRSISLGSSLAAMEIAGRQQSAATTNRVNSRVTMMVSYERIFRITLIELESNCCADRLPMPSSAGAALGRSDRHCEEARPSSPKNAPTATRLGPGLQRCAENHRDPCTATRARAGSTRSPD